MDTRSLVLLVLLLLPAGLAAGLLKLQFDDWRTRSWPSAPGRIVSSRAVARDVRTKRHSSSNYGDHRTKFITQEEVARRHFAEVEYEYVVAGLPLRGRRVGLGEDGGDYEVLETLRRYPEGAVVPVFYDPRDASQALLERLPLVRVASGWFGIFFVAALIVGLVYGVEAASGWLRGVIATPQRAPLVTFLGSFAMFLLVGAVGIARGARRAMAWPQAAGRIVVSRVESRLRTESVAGSSRSEYITMHTPRVIYAFEVEGVGFQGENVGAIVASNNPSGPARTVARWPTGKPVTVFYNPLNPAESTLRPSAGLWPLGIAAIGAAFAVAAAWTATV